MVARVFVMHVWGFIKVVVVICVLAISPPLRADELARADDAFLSHFETVVFGLEDNFGHRDDTVIRWSGPDVVVNWVAFAANDFGEPVPVAPRNHLVNLGKHHVVELAKATGLTFRDALTSGRSPDITVVFTTGALMDQVPLPGIPKELQRRLAQARTCFFVFRTRAGGEISRAFVVVNHGRAQFLTNHCLLEELAQALGAPNDSDREDASIFSEGSKASDLSPADRRVLWLLYHPEMMPGLSHGQALGLAQRLLETTKP